MNASKRQSSERPILFSGPMVRAILGGRKTQTRRIIPFSDPDRPRLLSVDGAVATFGDSIPDDPVPIERRCKYGAAGERLWVRETFDRHLGEVRYAATDSEPFDRAWRPSIFMPRWASRITLEVIAVRVERLQAISEEDAESEGCWALGDAECTARRQFSDLWDDINSMRAPWASNPWVWVVEFKRIDNVPGGGR